MLKAELWMSTGPLPGPGKRESHSDHDLLPRRALHTAIPRTAHPYGVFLKAGASVLVCLTMASPLSFKTNNLWKKDDGEMINLIATLKNSFTRKNSKRVV